DLRKKTLSDRAARPDMRRRQTFLLAPGFQRATHGVNRRSRILSPHNCLIEQTHHAAFRGELGDAERVLLPLVRMAVNVDGVLDADHIVERGIDGLLEAAASAVRCNRAGCARRGVVLFCFVHRQSSRLSSWLDNSASFSDGQTFSLDVKARPTVHWR